MTSPSAVARHQAGGTSALPLTGLRVVDLSDGHSEMCGRLLADLGAEVILVEPSGGARSRTATPMVDGVSTYFATHNWNKFGLTLDPTSPRDCEILVDLVATADVLIETGSLGPLSPWQLDEQSLRSKYPELIIASVTDFGRTGPYSEYVATGAVHLAMGGVLCRSGLPGKPPLLPPPTLAYETAAIQAAWCVLLAVWHRRFAGRGDHLDISVHEAVAQVIDPGLGMAGSAQAGQTSMDVERGRPDGGSMFPIFPCGDGYVRMAVLAPRQWHSLRDWMGDPEEFRSDEWNGVYFRVMAHNLLYPKIAELFADRPAGELVAEGHQRGVPISAVKNPSLVLSDEHFLERQSFCTVRTNSTGKGLAPAGYMEIDGLRAGVRRPAPDLGSQTASFTADRPAPWAAGACDPPEPDHLGARRPFAALRVLDLGVIVVGAEIGRLFADQGAEVIKIETRAFPDGNRQSVSGQAAMTPSFASGHRGKLSLGLNLRSEAGKRIFMDLAAQADVILSNFRPGTMESLGLGYDEVVKVNPQIIMADSSAFGSHGPKSKRMGYGPLIRAETGLTMLYSYPEIDGSFSDSVTTFPDHLGARIVATGVLACLLRREVTGVGGTVSAAQAEGILNALASEFLRESLSPGSFVATGNSSEYDAPHGVFPCKGNDEWCVIAVRDDRDWLALCNVVGDPWLSADRRLATAEDRVRNRKVAEAAVARWTKTLSPREVTAKLQAKGVPAGFMIRLDEYESDPHFVARRFVRSMQQSGLDGSFPMENGPCVSALLPDPDLRPAPFMGQHTRQIAADLLGMSDDEIADCIQAGVLEPL